MAGAWHRNGIVVHCFNNSNCRSNSNKKYLLQGLNSAVALQLCVGRQISGVNGGVRDYLRLAQRFWVCLEISSITPARSSGRA